ncbi:MULTISPECIES: heme exporter protein CcmD [Luteibacter]|uniref:Heme exporter protein D n=1 Tax=Luteibacter flocculans TaxID=2780091 RepID=A0ABY4T4W8_9GAMM|nr:MULTISPECIES: heme exporter protein CcmD [Luteibacter]URL59948.1 heme exporter protein CcmD [Luteibacter flocculans]SFW20403.1 heme exporter protein D [Luteibacter sp. UNCMF366Tsu5.1]
MSQSLSMGAYGFYVWSAVAVFFIVLLIDTLAPLARRRRNLRALRARIARQENRRRPGTPPQNESDA